MKRTDDDELVEKYRNGDIAAFDELLERYSKPLFNYIFRMLGDVQESEDALQEVFLRIIRNIGRYKMKGRFKSWIFAIANHFVVSQLRKRRRGQPLSMDEIPQKGESTLRVGDLIGDERFAPDAEAERKELKEKLEEAINSLPKEQRQILMLREFSGLPFKEIGKIVGCPVNTALSRMHYALVSLRNELAEFHS